jgi:hypothetical protein
MKNTPLLVSSRIFENEKVRICLALALTDLFALIVWSTWLHHGLKNDATFFAELPRDIFMRVVDSP